MIHTLRSRLASLATASLVLTLVGAMLPAQAATLTHLYEFNGNLSDTLGGPSLVSEGGTVTASSYSFGANQGLSLSNGLASGGNYSIGLLFSFDTTSGFRKVVDFQNLLSDNGFYILNSALDFFPLLSGPAGTFPNATTLPVVLTRDGATNVVAGYVNGVQQFSFNDTSNIGVFSVSGNPIRFFRDDNATSGRESSAGQVEEIRIFDGALTAQEVAGAFANVPGPVTTVPLPSSMLLLGTGLAGLLMQRRRARS